MKWRVDRKAPFCKKCFSTAVTALFKFGSSPPTTLWRGVKLHKNFITSFRSRRRGDAYLGGEITTPLSRHFTWPLLAVSELWWRNRGLCFPDPTSTFTCPREVTAVFSAYQIDGEVQRLCEYERKHVVVVKPVHPVSGQSINVISASDRHVDVVIDINASSPDSIRRSWWTSWLITGSSPFIRIGPLRPQASGLIIVDDAATSWCFKKLKSMNSEVFASLTKFVSFPVCPLDIHAVYRGIVLFRSVVFSDAIITGTAALAIVHTDSQDFVPNVIDFLVPRKGAAILLTRAAHPRPRIQIRRSSRWKSLRRQYTRNSRCLQVGSYSVPQTNQRYHIFQHTSHTANYSPRQHAHDELCGLVRRCQSVLRMDKD